ncbi:MAG: hypothetical protein ABIJ50_07855 [Pseudomonadota bacterium]
MDARDIDKLRCRQLAAVGRLMAGFTHELKNHLAIIKESNGLLADLVEMQRIADANLADRIAKIVSTTTKRVGMAADMARHLNGFAHRMDTPLATFQVNEMIGEEVCFLHRYARLQQVELKTSLADELPSIYNNPALFQFIFYSLFNKALAGLDAQGVIRIQTEACARTVQITLSMQGKAVAARDVSAEEGDDNVLAFAVAMTGASLEETRNAAALSDFVLCLPSISEEASG